MIAREKIGYIIIGVLCIVGAMIVTVRNSFEKKNVLENSAYSTARIFRCKSTGKGAGVGFYYYYVVSGTEYAGYRNYSGVSWKMADVFLNKDFSVIYNSKEPSKNYLLLLPRDFAEFEFEYPDSLQWVVKMIQ